MRCSKGQVDGEARVDGEADVVGGSRGLPEITTLERLARLVSERPGLHVRYSAGPEADAGSVSTDGESGLPLPGLSVNPLDPQPWWTRPLEDWLARQLCQYRHLENEGEERFAWVLRGRLVGRGPDSEPLLADVEPVARLAPSLLEEAERRYEERFERGRLP